ncbi:hypothetical protein Trydic_g3565 [Trypoxylus dichotomus]
MGDRVRAPLTTAANTLRTALLERACENSSYTCSDEVMNDRVHAFETNSVNTLVDLASLFAKTAAVCAPRKLRNRALALVKTTAFSPTMLYLMSCT